MSLTTDELCLQILNSDSTSAELCEMANQSLKHYIHNPEIHDKKPEEATCEAVPGIPVWAENSKFLMEKLEAQNIHLENIRTAQGNTITRLLAEKKELQARILDTDSQVGKQAETIRTYHKENQELRKQFQQKDAALKMANDRNDYINAALAECPGDPYTDVAKTIRDLMRDSKKLQRFQGIDLDGLTRDQKHLQQILRQGVEFDGGAIVHGMTQEAIDQIIKIVDPMEKFYNRFPAGMRFLLRAFGS